MVVGLKLSGKILKGKEQWYYDMRLNGGTFCQDFTQYVHGRDGCVSMRLGQRTYASTPTWGGKFVDKPKRRTAIIMLMAAQYGLRSMYFGYHPWHEYKTITLKHYKQFAEEVVAHLPDNWTMTGAQIKRWITKQEKKRKKK